MYNKIVLDHFKNPRNAGKIDHPDAIGKAGNPTCGDTLNLYIKVDKNKVISAISVETFGCAAAIATASMVTTLAKGKTLEDAEKITNKDVAKALGGLPPKKMHCSNMAADVLQDAIRKYYEKNSEK